MLKNIKQPSPLVTKKINCIVDVINRDFNEYNLNDWEINFLNNIYNSEIISKKQASILKKIFIYNRK